MRLPWQLLIFLGACALSIAIWFISGGRAFVFLLPLMFGLPLFWRRR